MYNFQLFPVNTFCIFVKVKKQLLIIAIYFIYNTIYKIYDTFSSLKYNKFMTYLPHYTPGESHGRKSLVDYSPWGRKELDTTERPHFHFHYIIYWIIIYYLCSKKLVAQVSAHIVPHSPPHKSYEIILLSSLMYRWNKNLRDINLLKPQHNKWWVFFSPFHLRLIS